MERRQAKHNPAREGYSLLTRDDLATARNDFHHACGQLYVHANNRFIEYLDDPSSSSGENIDVAEARSMITKYINIYPEADHYSLSPHDIHPDHSAVGTALLGLFSEGRIQTKIQFFISMATRLEYEKNNKPIPGNGSKETPNHPKMKDLVLNACRCYSAWAPSQGAYAIGYHSVAPQFWRFAANPFHQNCRQEE